MKTCGTCKHKLPPAIDWTGGFLLACTLMHNSLSDELDAKALQGAFNIQNMAVSYDCNLRNLTANFTWQRINENAPHRLWLEISMFKDMWSPKSESAQQILLDSEATSLNLSIETDSVYYWRLKFEVNGEVSNTETKQIYTPNCVADFVQDA